MLTPILILCDAPNLETGLARIARDLATGLYQARERLGVAVGQLGLGYDGSPFPWPVYPVFDESNWAADDLRRVWQWHSGGRPGVLLTIWDPSRCFPTAQVGIEGLKRWGYVAIDGCSSGGRLNGPPAASLYSYDRVLAYGCWGAQIISNTLSSPSDGFPASSEGEGGGSSLSVEYLPHGADLTRFRPRFERPQDATWVGCVMQNNPRKDFYTLFATVAKLRALWKRPVKLWLHTDLEVKAWSVPQLAIDFGFNNDSLLVTDKMTDDELARTYSSCSVVLLPSLGEGFGYPLVEAMACGTPVVHVGHAGGAELVPDGVVSYLGRRVESIFNIERPILCPDRFALSALEKLAYKEHNWIEATNYYRGQVSYLDWRMLWPRWESWFRKGLKMLEETMTKKGEQ